MTLFEMTVSAGVMILVTAVIRAFAVDRLPKRLFLALWGVVILRLLVPFSVPLHFSPFSFTESSAYASAPSAVSTHNAELIRAVRLSEKPLQPDVDLWTVLWLTGLSLAVLFFASAYLWQLRRFRYAREADNAFISSWLASHPLRRTVSIRESGKITAPLTYGIFRPVIIIPEGMDRVDTDTLSYAFSHEYTHIRRFDALLRMLLTAALCVHWFNPLVWVMYILALRDIELSCDEKVVRDFGFESRRAYALSLLKMEETRRCFNAFASGFSKNAARERLRAVMRLRKTTALRAAVSVFLVTGSFLVLCTCAEASDMLVKSPDLIRVSSEDFHNTYAGGWNHLGWIREEGFIELQITGKGEGSFGFFLCKDDTNEAEGQWITLDGSTHELWLEVPEKGDYYIYVCRDYQRIDDENDSFTYKVIYTCYTSEGRRVFRWNRSRFCDGFMERGYIYTS